MNKTASNDEKVTGIVNLLESEIEELEEKIAPSKGINLNHNETMVRDSEAEEIDLEIEELEAKIAPGKTWNHNETFVRDTEN